MPQRRRVLQSPWWENCLKLLKIRKKYTRKVLQIPKSRVAAIPVSGSGDIDDPSTPEKPFERY
jgi:hypothetical protein